MFTSVIRAHGSPDLAMFCILSGAILNIALDPLFIYVFDMGIKGTIWAIVSGQLISLVLLLTIFLILRPLN